MFQFLQVLTLVLVATTLTFALAHVAEWPGKLRLDKDAYLTVQTIYYPGFTIGGISEPVSMLALLVLTISTPRESPAFGWMLAALASMTAMHLIFWLVTQPVNKVWLRDQEWPEQVQFSSTGAKHAPAARLPIGRRCVIDGNTSHIAGRFRDARSDMSCDRDHIAGDLIK